MQGGGRIIDVATWKRRDHFALFRQYQQPFFSVTAEVDVTALWQRRSTDSRGRFFMGTLYALARALHATEPLRLRLRGDEVWLHDAVGIGITTLRTDDTFGFARIDLLPSFDAFCRTAEPIVELAKQPAPLDPMTEIDDIIYHSVMPWLRFTSYTNAMAPGDSIPRIMFGKASPAAGRFVMPVAVEVHHALVDGIDVARFLEAFETELAAL